MIEHTVNSALRRDFEQHRPTQAQVEAWLESRGMQRVIDPTGSTRASRWTFDGSHVAGRVERDDDRWFTISLVDTVGLAAEAREQGYADAVLDLRAWCEANPA